MIHWLNAPLLWIHTHTLTEKLVNDGNKCMWCNRQTLFIWMLPLDPFLHLDPQWKLMLIKHSHKWGKSGLDSIFYFKTWLLTLFEAIYDFDSPTTEKNDCSWLDTWKKTFGCLRRLPGILGSIIRNERMSLIYWYDWHDEWKLYSWWWQWTNTAFLWMLLKQERIQHSFPFLGQLFWKLCVLF